ncbi:MAG: Fic family protein [Alkalinema sp. RL_2_19]|nr:Fic family protein [Alkalinema sp. RL_2_19]
MNWNWQQPEWPRFKYESEILEPLERLYTYQSGELYGTVKHIDATEQQLLTIEIMLDEAMKTSEIEGEYLNRDSVQSSIRRNLGLDTSRRSAPPAEAGIAEMMVNLYQGYADPLSHESLYQWHQMLMNGRRDIEAIGCYRTHQEAMQVVSGRIDKPTIHFQAPPSASIRDEMQHFIDWFSRTAPNGETPLQPLTRAGITHLYFVSIHPFEDGNGRIARALAEKVLAQHADRPLLITLSQQIDSAKKDYYAALEANNRSCTITSWLTYFAETVIAAQQRTIELVEFSINKAKFYEQYLQVLNERQQKVIERIFLAGPVGFIGGLSAKNYRSIAKTTASTATRDLQDLVDKGILQKTGERKGTRYSLLLSSII